MKSTTNSTPNYVKSITMIILGIVFAVAFCATPANAQSTQDKTEWVEVNSVDLPEGIEVFSGISRSGNPKYWIEIEGIKVFLSPTNKEHYINGTATIVLVEWYNNTLDRYKYTTRQKKQSKQSKRINLEKI